MHPVMGVCCTVFDIDGMLFEFFMNFLNIEILFFNMQIVDKGNFNMMLNGRWFLQIVDRGGIYIQYI